MYSVGGHGCGHSPHHGHDSIVGHPSACCCHPGEGFRKFHSREEQISRLEEYLKALQAEVKGVEESIAELKKG